MTSPEDIIDAFERGHSLVNRFRAIQQPKGGRDADLAIDADGRLWQATYLLRRFRQLEIEHRQKRDARIAADMKSTNMMINGQLDSAASTSQDVLRLHGEAFYYFAWRACAALSAIKSVAGLSFVPVGVRDVRNRLIEHPGGAGGYFVLSWMLGDPHGLVLAFGAGPNGQTLDRGLYPNAREFIEKLLPKIEQVLAMEQ
jgi:hypothetical protein